MIRIRLLANCLADPTGIKFRGYEVEVPEEQAALLVASGQWARVQPPPPPRATAAAADPDAEWTSEAAAAIAAAATRREFRGRRRAPAPGAQSPPAPAS